MKLLVGLGNPGSEYATTRHNIGFMVARRVAERAGIVLKKKGYMGLYGVGSVASQQATIVLPQTYMNRSGDCVRAVSAALKTEAPDILVIYDDLDLGFGRLKISPEGGHGGHNGIRSILDRLGRRDFVRLRIGIGRPQHGDVTAHVLSRFNSEEQAKVAQLIDVAADAAETVLGRGAGSAMNDFNGFSLD